MKKNLMVWATALFFACISTVSYSQNSLEGAFDQVMSLSQKGGDNAGLASALGMATSMLEKETKGGDPTLSGKILSQVSSLKALIPLATQGKVQAGSISKILNTIKMLVAANRLKGILGGGKSSLAGNSSAILGNLNLMKSATAILGGGTQNQLEKLIGSATKSVGKLDKKGFMGNLAATATDKKLNKLVGLVSSAF